MERLDEAVRGALRGAGVPDAGVLADVARCWPQVVGDAIARASWPRRISRDGTLQVAAISSTWAFELGLLADQILGGLAAAIGSSAPTAIRFTPGDVPAPAAPAPPTPAAVPLEADAETQQLARELTTAMTDRELRELIARAAAASLARAAANRCF